MSPSELDDLLLRHADQPLRMTLASGDRVIVPNTVQTTEIEGFALRIVRDRSPMHRRVTAEYLSIPNIVRVETLDADWSESNGKHA